MKKHKLVEVLRKPVSRVVTAAAFSAFGLGGCGEDSRVVLSDGWKGDLERSGDVYTARLARADTTHLTESSIVHRWNVTVKGLVRDEKPYLFDVSLLENYKSPVDLGNGVYRKRFRYETGKDGNYLVSGNGYDRGTIENLTKVSAELRNHPRFSKLTRNR